MPQIKPISFTHLSALPTPPSNPFLCLYSHFRDSQPSTHLHNLENWQLSSLPHILSPVIKYSWLYFPSGP